MRHIAPHEITYVSGRPYVVVTVNAFGYVDVVNWTREKRRAFAAAGLVPDAQIVWEKNTETEEGHGT